MKRFALLFLYFCSIAGQSSLERKGDIDRLLEAICHAETGSIPEELRPVAVSKVGAIGRCQLMPDTAVELGVNPWNDAENILGARAYIKENLFYFRYARDPVLCTIQSYNAGRGAADEFGCNVPYEETVRYTEKVRAYLAGRAI